MKNKIALIFIFSFVSIAFIKCQKYEWDYENVYTKLQLFFYFPQDSKFGYTTGLNGIERINVVQKVDGISGEIVDSIKIPFINDIPTELYRIVYIQETHNLVLLGSMFKKSNGSEVPDSSFIVSILLDTTLKVQDINYYYVTDHSYIFHIDYYLNSQNEILLTCNNYKDYPTGTNAQIVTAKLDEGGKMIDFELINFSYHSPCLYVVPEIGNENYLCIGGKIFRFSPEFKFQTILPDFYPQFLFGNMLRVMRWGANYYLAGTSTGSKYKEFKIGSSLLYLIDKDFNIVKHNGININDEFAYAMPSSTFDITADSMIYLGNTQDYLQGTERFSVGKFDKELNSIWRLDFSELGLYRYLMRGVRATPDGGVVVFGHRSPWDGGTNLRTGYFIKFNAEGNLVSTSDNDHSGLRLVRVYPNPVSDICSIHLTGYHDGCDIRLYDMNGRIVYVRHDARDGAYQIDMSGLSSGQYIYKIYQSDKEVSSGQIVKI
ncbi:MAG: T9SS type A sorting domain-containing protein [Saprospiraceae bacterium]|nr:T9SS type A sorting domain-containing protein [Saprospiraceae bacterium]